MPCHIFGDRGLPNVDAELEEFSMNPGSAHSRLARLMARINCWISNATCGLPPRDRDVHRQNERNQLWLILGDGVNQAADLASGATSIPSWNLTPWMTFGNWFPDYA